MAIKIDNVKVKAGRLVRVANQEMRKRAATQYVAVWVEDADGSNERCILFTEKEIKRAEDRAAKNPEDLTKKSWLESLTD